MGASSLEYEPTIPTRFMVGTEKGIVMNCNRKGKTPLEKIVGQYQAHVGPVTSLQRNPSFLKNFLTVGDWTARIWSEDVRDSAIIWTCFHRVMLTGGTWSPTRFSVFYTTRMDGSLDVWDIIQQQREPCLSVKVCDEALRSLRIHESGQLVAVGNDVGTTYLVEFSDNLAITHRNDRHLLTQMFERENRREKILEGRMREQRLKVRAKSEVGGAPIEATGPSSRKPTMDYERFYQHEKEFFDVVNQGLDKLEQRKIAARPQEEKVESEVESEADAVEESPEKKDEEELGNKTEEDMEAEKTKDKKKAKKKSGKKAGGGTGAKKAKGKKKS